MSLPEKSRTESPSRPPVLHVLGATTELVRGEVHCTVRTHCQQRMTLAFSPSFARQTGKDLFDAGAKARRAIG